MTSIEDVDDFSAKTFHLIDKEDYISRQKMLLLAQPRVRLRDFLCFATVAGLNHATSNEAESMITFSTVYFFRENERREDKNRYPFGMYKIYCYSQTYSYGNTLFYLYNKKRKHLHFIKNFHIFVVRALAKETCDFYHDRAELLSMIFNLSRLHILPICLLSSLLIE